MRGRRAFVVVLDACGVGALPDAAGYGDAGTNTLAHVAERVGGLDLPVLGALGLGSIVPLRGVPAVASPVLHGRLHPLGPGKDSATGHWELMGAVLPAPLPTFPDGIPATVIDLVADMARRPVLGGGRLDGLTALAAHGEPAWRTGGVIAYTSQDSVLQLAAHVDGMSESELYVICARVRAALPPAHAVGRVIARPFAGEPGGFTRTEGRRDFALLPPGPTYLDRLAEAGVPVHGVGKVGALFPAPAVAVSHPGATNARALAASRLLLADLEAGLVFVNLVETDEVHGHRKDAEGFHRALREIDAEVGGWRAEGLGDDDLLVLCADHGCDPDHPLTDHTREHAPLLAAFAGHGSRRHDGPLADVGASVLAWLTGAEAPDLPGDPFV